MRNCGSRHVVYNFGVYKIIKVCLCIVQLKIAQISHFLDALILPIDIIIMLCFVQITCKL
jgi:hypothetical protein